MPIVSTPRSLDLARVRRSGSKADEAAEWLALVAGFAGGDRARQNEATLVRFLDSRRVDLILADEDTPHHYERLFQQLRRQGTPIPTNDLWIAALVVQYQLHLFARDTHFDHLPQIPRL